MQNQIIIYQCAKKYTSDRPGRVIYNIGQVHISIDLSDGQVTFFAHIYWQIIDKFSLQKAELIRKLSVSAIVVCDRFTFPSVSCVNAVKSYSSLMLAVS